MKVLSLTILLGLAAAVPTTPIQSGLKRASISDVATIGYATLNGGTTGGSGGKVVTVSTLAEFVAAVAEKNTAPTIVLVNGTLVGNEKVRVGSNKSILGLPGSSLKGIGLIFKKQKNLIVRNIKSSFVLASNEDALKIDESTNVWVDHCEFHSALGNDKDQYDGLVDSSHGSDFVTVSHTYFHDHWKTSLVGHSDSNAAQDKGKLRITYANNYWRDLGSRTPLIRFGTAHIFNSYYQNVGSGINTRMGAQVLVQNNVFKNVTTAITSRDSKEVGFAVVEGNDLGRSQSNAPAGSLRTNNIPYKFTLLSTSAVGSVVPLEAGPILVFDEPDKPATTTTTTSSVLSTTSTKSSTTASTPTTLTTTTRASTSTSTSTFAMTTTSAPVSSTSIGFTTSTASISAPASTLTSVTTASTSAVISTTSELTTVTLTVPEPTSPTTHSNTTESFSTTTAMETTTQAVPPTATSSPTTEAEACEAEPTATSESASASASASGTGTGEGSVTTSMS